jgi:acetyltransferase-like isoleucine patch superfamily enzyme
VAITPKIPCLFSEDSRIEIGRFTYGNPEFKLWQADEKIQIGSFCSIADNVVIFAGGEHNTHWITTYPLRIVFDLLGKNQDGHPATKGQTIIGNDVWIGYGATILSGVKIGDGAVIGACSVVASDVPAYAIYAGNPARHVRYRFKKREIKKIQKLAWWDWPLESIILKADLLCSPEIRKFLSEY